jgi:hypothetical protein
VDVWILVGSLVAALVGVVALALALRRARARATATDALVLRARTAVREAVEIETAAHTEEIRRVLARERAESATLLAEAERRHAEARRAELVEHQARASDRIAEELARAEGVLDERLRVFSEDLDRAQRHLEGQVRRLEQTQREALAVVEARVEAEAAELGSTADEQRKVVVRLREELERAAGQAVTEALDELESQTIERRRSIEEITERLRARETAIAESIERAESDVRGRLDVLLVEWERRQTERLVRVTEREIERHTQVAMMAFDERMRDTREDAVTRLKRELDRAVELLSREELVRRIDADGG